MSQSNAEKKVNSSENRISVNEQGEVIIHDPELSSTADNLSDEELDEIAGGQNNCTIINKICRES